jgi:hypothetical protein
MGGGVMSETIARALWQLRFAPNLDEVVVDVLVRSMPRRHRRNLATRHRVEELARDLAVAVSQFNQPDDSFEEFREIFADGFQRGFGD